MTLFGFRAFSSDCKVVIGPGLLADAGELLASHTPFKRFGVITNPTVRRLHGAALEESLDGAGLECEFFEVPDSEASKSVEMAAILSGQLSEAGFDRSCCVIGFGGGVVGDLAGFVAATYHRGIGLVQIPTTLLAQADSSIGGKSAVDIPQGKNLVGAFHQPAMVISDIDILATLPDPHFRSGFAEVVKCGFGLDPDFFTWLEDNAVDLLGRERALVEHAVTSCARIKAGIVQEDERDAGRRQLLNLGHTLGHAIEAASGYARGHGESVSVGLVFAARISCRTGLLDDEAANRLENLLKCLGLPVRIPSDMDSDALLAQIKVDKKNRGGAQVMVLPTGIGQSIIETVNLDIIRETIEGLME